MLKRYPLALYTLWFTAMVIFPLPLILLINHTMLTSSINQLFLIDIGVIAYSWWLFEVYLSLRPRWLDQLIGLPALYFVHSFLGIGALLLGFIHWHYLLSMDQWITLSGEAAWYMAFGVALYSIFFMSGWIVDHFKIANDIKKKITSFLKHELSLWIHRLNLLAIVLIRLHVHLIGRINIHTSFMLLFDTYTFVIISSYLWHHVICNRNTSLGYVFDTVSISPTVIQVQIKLTNNDVIYQAGDYFFLSFEGVNGISSEPHPFSVTNIPNIDHPIVFTIRKLGDFTQSLSTLKRGDKVLLEGPFGQFSSIIEQDKSQAPLIMIGMGTGIAPLLGLAQQYIKRRKIRVIWTTKNNFEQYIDYQS